MKRHLSNNNFMRIITNLTKSTKIIQTETQFVRKKKYLLSYTSGDNWSNTRRHYWFFSNFFIFKIIFLQYFDFLVTEILPYLVYCNDLVYWLFHVVVIVTIPTSQSPSAPITEPPLPNGHYGPRACLNGMPNRGVECWRHDGCASSAFIYKICGLELKHCFELVNGKEYECIIYISHCSISTAALTRLKLK